MSMKQAGHPSAPNPTVTGPTKVNSIARHWPTTTAYIAFVLLVALLLAVLR